MCEVVKSCKAGSTQQLCPSAEILQNAWKVTGKIPIKGRSGFERRLEEFGELSKPQSQNFLLNN